MLTEAQELLQEVLLFKLYAVPKFPAKTLHDHFSDLDKGHCFLDDAQNQLSEVQDWLIQQLTTQPNMLSHFTHQTTHRNKLKYHKAAMHDYLQAHQHFLQLLTVLMYITDSLPPHGKELVGIQWHNWQTLRNIFISHNLVIMMTGYHKMQHHIGTQLITHFLLPMMGNLLIQYLIYILSFVRFLQHCMQKPHPQGFLFSEGETAWNSQRFGQAVISLTRRFLGMALTTRQWRHIAIALDRRILGGDGCRAHGVTEKPFQPGLHAGADDSDGQGDDGGDELAAVSHMQAAHTARIGNRVYGNDFSMQAGMTDQLLAGYRRVSERWHTFVGLSDVCSRGTKRPLSSSAAAGPSAVKVKVAAGSSLHVRKKLWIWPALEATLRVLFGPAGTARDDHQRNALLLIARSLPETIVVMPTGSGKTVLFVAPTLLPQAEVTVVITPLVALKQDLTRRCREWNVPHAHYHPSMADERLHAVPSLLFVDVEQVSSVGFQTLLEALARHGRLDRIVLDEAHLVLTASHYRQELGRLITLRRFPCPFVCLTATLPPPAERDLKWSLGFTAAEVLRVSSDRPNLQYRIQYLTTSTLHAVGSDPLVDEAVTICMRDQQRYTWNPGARFVCYVRRKQVGERLAARLGCHLYHTDVEDRAQVLTAWGAGEKSTVIVATAALGAGVDLPGIRHVLHLDAPTGLLDYAQETGRAGRDGGVAECTTLLAPGWRVSWDTGFRSNFHAQDSTQMTQFLTPGSSRCLRQQLTSYLNGDEGVCCWDARSTATHRVPRLLCGVCEQQTDLDARQTSELHATSPLPVQLSVRMQPRRVNSSVSSSATKTSDTPEPAAVHSEDDNSEGSEDDNSEGSEDNNSEGSEDDNSEGSEDDNSEDSESEEAAKTEDDDPTGSDDEHATTYHTALARSRLHAMTEEENRACYEERVAYWTQACLPCSYRERRRLVRQQHQCDGQVHEQIARLRSRLHYEGGVGCFRCGLPRWICESGPRRCVQSNVVPQSCWMVLHAGTDGLPLLTALGSPTPPPRATDDLGRASGARYLTWLGRKSQLLGQPASNAAAVTHLWLNYMEGHCTRAPGEEEEE